MSKPCAFLQVRRALDCSGDRTCRGCGPARRSCRGLAPQYATSPGPAFSKLKHENQTKHGESAIHMRSDLSLALSWEHALRTSLRMHALGGESPEQPEKPRESQFHFIASFACNNNIMLLSVDDNANAAADAPTSSHANRAHPGPGPIDLHIERPQNPKTPCRSVNHASTAGPHIWVKHALPSSHQYNPFLPQPQTKPKWPVPWLMATSSCSRSTS
jgi:hypothetical protein